MTLNHVNLAVPDVSEARDFFEAHFGFRCVTERENGTLSLLEDGAGFVLALSNFDKAERHVYPKGFHVGFVLDSADAVRETHGRLKAAGVRVQDSPLDTRRGLTFYGDAPGGVLFEVCSRPQ